MTSVRLPLRAPWPLAVLVLLFASAVLLLAPASRELLSSFQRVEPVRGIAPPPAGLPLDFIQNEGQWPASTRFVAHGRSLAAAFERDTIRLNLGPGPGESLALGFQGSSADVRLAGEQKQDGHYNYAVGNDRARWRSGVPAYESILYRGLYDGIDLRVRAAAGRIEYDALVAPGADLDRVLVRAEGAKSASVARNGSLLLKTAAGTLRQDAPLAWDVLPGGKRRMLESRFELRGSLTYGFAVTGHDSSRPLVVDPGLDWATFVGGSGDESVTGIERVSDGTGDIVIAGQTQSPDFPRTVTTGSLKPVGWTPYVARVSADGTRMVYVTFFGGTFNHGVLDVGLDAQDRPAVVGDTNSLDFPTTPGAYDRTPGDGFHGDYDAFVIKFNADGSGPIFGTYLAGAAATGWEQAWNVAFDSAGSPIVSGFNTSSSFPTTAGAYDRTTTGQDIFISRLSPDGSALTYSTFFGGDGGDETYDMVVDPQGFVSLTGKTTNAAGQLNPFPTTPDAFDRTLDLGGNTNQIDAFVARLKLDGNGAADLKYSTYLSGAQWKEAGTGIAFDPNDPTVVAVGGWTYSADFPTTLGAFQREHFTPIDASMAFATKFRFPAAGPGQLLWSTLWGAPGGQGADDITIDGAGRPILVGATATNNPPTTAGAYDRIPGIGSGRGDADAFIARLSADGSRNEYSTLLGGGSNDEIAQNVVYAGGNSVVVAGLTDSTDFPVTTGAFDTTYAADGQPTLADDVFVSKLTLDAVSPETTPPPAPGLKGPADLATYTAHVMNATFDWAEVADASGIRAYHVQVSPNAEFKNDITAELNGWWETWEFSSLMIRSFSVSNTGTFWWRVQALDGAGNLGPWSAVRRIVVNSPTPPDAPILASPPDGGRFGPGNIILDWNPAARAKFYELQIDTTSAFSNANKVWIRAITATRYTHNFTTAARNYWWRVRASNDSFTDGPWSAVRSVEIRSGSPPAPIPPPDNDPGVGGPPPGGALAVSKLTPEELPLSGGQSGQLTVNLTAPAPAGGAVVRLESKYTDVATVPASVTVPAGATSAPFTVTARSGLQRYGVTTITAEYGDTAAQGIQLIVFADISSPELYALSIAGTNVSTNGFTQGKATFLGGQTVQGTVGFIPGWVAPPGGARVALASTDPSLASVPDFVTVPAGQNSVSFNVTTQNVSQLTQVTILAARSMTHRIVLELLPPGALQALSLNPQTVIGGQQNSTGTITLAGPAPAGGVTLALSSHDTRWATVPASVTVPAGSSSTTFTVTSLPNNSGEGQWSMITASAGGISLTRTINVNPPPIVPPGQVALSTFVLDPSTVVGGTASTGRVTLTGPAPAGGTRVDIFSNNAVATVPPSISIPAGSTSGPFTISTTAVTGFNQTVSIVIGTTNSSREAFLTVTPAPAQQPPAALSGVSVNPTAVDGGTSSTGTVILTSPAPAGGFAVSLSSNNAAASVPASVTVPAGVTSANFTVTTTSVTTTQSPVISAVAGTVTQTATLTVNPAAAPPPAATVSLLSLNPVTVTGGTASSGTVTLSGAAPAGGLVVTLSSSNTAAASVPGSVTVAAGATSASFSIPTISGTTERTSLISATTGAVTRTATLTVSASPAPPPAADVVTITRLEYGSGRLRIEASSSSTGATLTAYVTSTGALIATLSGGKFDGNWPTNPVNVTVKSSLGGSASKAV